MKNSSTSRAASESGGWQPVGYGILQFADGVNSYLVPSGPGRAIVIDPGRGAWWTKLAEIGIESVEAIIVTHLHRDTICGLYRQGPLAEQYRGEIWVPAADASFTREGELEAFWQKYQSSGCPANYLAPRRSLSQSVRTIGADSEARFGEVRLSAVATPGHSRGALSYLIRRDQRQVAFCGDAAHAGGTLCELYHLEWDHWTPEGALQAWYGLERLRGNRIDRLFPGHGPVVKRQPRQMLSRLQQKLLRFVSAKTAIAENEPSRWLDTESIAAGVNRITPNLYAFGGNGYLLASEDGHALIFDPQHADIPALERLLEQTCLAPEIVTASHYHIDHVDGLGDVTQRFSAASWLHPWVAEPLQDRDRYDVPWLPKDSIVPDRLLPEEGRFRWREYDIGVRPYPGQTWWHCAFDTVVDGHKVLISGDNFQPPSRWNGTGGFCAFNGSRFSEGFARSARAGLEIDPEIVCNGHRCLYAFDAGHYEAITRWSDEAEKTVADLCSQNAWRADYDPRMTRFDPFVQKVRAGETLKLHVAITNHHSTRVTAMIEPITAEGLRLTPARRRLTLQPGMDRKAEFSLTIDRGVRSGRYLVAADVQIAGVIHLESCVGLVDVCRPRRHMKGMKDE